MNNKMKPIQLDFKPSITLTLIFCVMGISAGAILILPALLLQIKLLLVFAILAAIIYTVCQYGLLLLPWSCIALNINSSNQLQLVHKSGRVLSVDLCRDSVVTPYLTVINCKPQDAKLLARLFAQHLVILPDMLDADDYRQLRVWLRWGAPIQYLSK
jgi:toxin CptA